MTLPLRAIMAFHATARTGTMQQAAQAIGVTPSAISQQIQILEHHIGTRLFNRVGRKVVLTEAGDRYFAMIHDELERIEAATEHLRGHNAITVLNVRIAPTFATQCIVPKLTEFLEAYPNIELRLDATNDPPDYTKEHIDLEIRHGDGNWSGLHSERLVNEPMLPLCSPDYLAPGSVTIAELEQYRLIHSVKNLVQWPDWFARIGYQPGRPLTRVLFDRAYMSIDLAVQGAGIALESGVIAAREMAAGSLTCPLASPPSVWQSSLWIVCPHAHLRRHKVRSFITWIKSAVVASELEGMSD
ncbi:MULTISPECIES: LysR substrate-binding domain-containing protein [unclassified Halomonas]|uniref:LysR substrate-binding domain-containing protein n=1 Tax=unclassified Halomonas TaxID=2609666 RepID=UPI00257F5E7A|nr:LysR substrate-binding domain-containing protein [Halomonas sp.]MCJ8284436.1 LysR substrate-binding domain-containing protein [Halomonas sp.]NQY69490.1 LysR family transcriptional regulator [Halomonas sp.]